MTDLANFEAYVENHHTHISEMTDIALHSNEPITELVNYFKKAISQIKTVFLQIDLTDSLELYMHDVLMDSLDRITTDDLITYAERIMEIQREGVQ